MKPILYISMVLFLSFNVLTAQTITGVNGDVRVRRGVQENWEPAKVGMRLHLTDTILCLEGSVDLLTDDNAPFTLGYHSILDINDLTRVSRQDLFLYLTSLKIEKIVPRSEKANAEKVSLVHATNKNQNQPVVDDMMTKRTRQLNGATALYDNGLVANALLKWHKILSNYPDVSDCGQLNESIAIAFQDLSETGRAIETWNLVLQESSDCESLEAKKRQENAKAALDNLVP